MRKPRQMTKRHPVKQPDGTFKKTHRNDPCPCGRQETRVYRDAKGEIFKEETDRKKFKKCCMHQSDGGGGEVLSTHQAILQNAGRFKMRRLMARQLGYDPGCL